MTHITIAVSLACCAMPLAAQSVAQHEDLLIQVLALNAAGQCPAALMSAPMKADCDRQLPDFRETLVRLGPVTATVFEGRRAVAIGPPTEVYRVLFEHGEMTWLINTGSDGKIQRLWGPNEPHWNAIASIRP